MMILKKTYLSRDQMVMDSFLKLESRNDTEKPQLDKTTLK